MAQIIAGASSGLGRALAEVYAAAGENLVLLSRDIKDIRVIANHLEIRHGITARAVALDFGQEALSFAAVDAVLPEVGALSGVCVTVGANDDQDLLGLDRALQDRLIRANFLGPCQLVNYYLPHIRANRGSLMACGSVAGIRGRSRNTTYAASKRALETYFEGLMQQAAQQGYACQFYILGYMDTNLAFAQKLAIPPARPDKLAQRIYLRRHKVGKQFLPRLWYIPCKVLQLLPLALYKKLSF